MFGLTDLQKILDPETTVQKIAFLLEHAFTKMHQPTTIISFSALAILVVLRSIKTSFKKYWFIYRLPEVLVVVLASTCMSPPTDGLCPTRLIVVVSPMRQIPME